MAVAPGTAHAGRSFFGWLYGTEVMPERGAELLTWIDEQNHQGGASETRWWVGPLIGITDQLELALPVEIAWDEGGGEKTRTSLDRYGAELRYRLVTSDPVDAPALVPLVRIALKRLVTQRDTWNPEADLVVSYTQGRVQVLADAGFYGEISPGGHHFEAHPGAGISIEAIDQLRFGAEIHAELSFDQGGSWAIVGPNMSWSHGRTWITAVYGIGFYGIGDAPKVLCGIAF